jgi:hypothetical protein
VRKEREQRMKDDGKRQQLTKMLPVSSQRGAVESETEKLAVSLRGFNREVKRNTLLLADTAGSRCR